MTADLKLISRIKQYLAQSNRIMLDLTGFPIQDYETMQSVLALIAGECPADWSIKIDGTEADATLQALVQHSEQFPLRDRIPILSRLIRVDLRFTRISDHGVGFLAAAVQTGQLSQLQHLDLSRTQITDGSVIRLVEAAQAGWLQQLQSLNLSDTRITDASVIHLADAAQAGQLQQLQHLDLSYTQITDASVIHLADVAQAGWLQQLQSLDLSRTQITDASVIRLAETAQAGWLQQLQSLDLSYTQITDASVIHLAEAAQAGQLPQLRHLFLSCREITDGSVVRLAEAAQAGWLQQLQSLDLPDTRITDASVIPLAVAVQAGLLPQLQLLDLSRMQITDASVIRLAEAAQAGQFPQLRLLCLSDTEITDGSVIRLAETAQAGQLQQLRHLDLSDTEITDASVIRLAETAQAGQLQQLDYLDLSATQITDGSVIRLAEAAQSGQLPQLRYLRLSGSRVSAPEAILRGTVREVFQWYHDRAQSNSLMPELKLLIVGQGNVGKSVLLQRVLLGQEPANLHARLETHDFDMHNVQLPSELITQEQFADLTLRAWDFAGQDELHGSHKFFVGAERAFYLLVLDASRDSRENKLTYWLRFLAQHGTLRKSDGDLKAPVLIVVAQSDKIVLAQEDRTSAGDRRTPETILSNHRELLAALESAAGQDYLQAHVLDVVDDLGYPSEDDLLALTSDSRMLIERRHKQACDEIRRLIATNLEQVIGIHEIVPPSDRAIRDWVLTHFTDGEHSLTRFNFRHEPFHHWAKEQGFDRNENQEIDSDVLELRFRNAMKILKSLGLVHWLGDVLAESADADDPLNDVAFNPLWVKTPVYRILRAQGVKHAKGWISQTNLNALLPLRESRPFRHQVTADNVREWFDHLSFTKEDRTAIKKLLTLSGLMFEVTQHQQKEGWLIPDMLTETVEIESPISEDAATIKNNFPFLPDRVLLRFLAERLVEAFGKFDERNDAIGELRSARVFRNAADMPWKLAGSEEAYRVLLRTEISPPIYEEPWLSISVSGSDEAGRMIILTEVISRFNDILGSEDLPLISLAEIRQRIPNAASWKVRAAADCQAGASNQDAALDHDKIKAFCDMLGISEAELTKPIKLGDDPTGNLLTIRRFYEIGRDFRLLDKDGGPKNSLNAVYNSLIDQLSAVKWKKDHNLPMGRGLFFKCPAAVERFFAQHFYGRNTEKSVTLFVYRESDRQCLNPTELGWWVWEQVRQYLVKEGLL